VELYRKVECLTDKYENINVAKMHASKCCWN